MVVIVSVVIVVHDSCNRGKYICSRYTETFSFACHVLRQRWTMAEAVAGFLTLGLCLTLEQVRQPVPCQDPIRH